MSDIGTVFLALNDSESVILYVSLKKWRRTFPEDAATVNNLLNRIYDQSPVLKQDYLAPEETYAVK